MKYGKNSAVITSVLGLKIIPCAENKPSCGAIRYSVSESTDELTIVLALICTSNKSYPTQFFFNGSSNDAVAAVQNILLTITAERSDDNSNDVVKEPEAVVISAPAPTTVEVKLPTKEVPGNETYIVGNEPPKLRERLERFFEKLHGAYPDKVIIGLDKDHKHWAETATILYRELGYESKRDFFAAYGFSVGVSDNKGGRPKKDHMAIVEELKRRYADGPVYATILELKAANPDLAPRFQNLMNQANTFFGMPLAKYFTQEGILVAKPDTAAALEESYDEEFAKLKSRFAQEPYSHLDGDLCRLISFRRTLRKWPEKRYVLACYPEQIPYIKEYLGDYWDKGNLRVELYNLDALHAYWFEEEKEGNS